MITFTSPTSQDGDAPAPEVEVIAAVTDAEIDFDVTSFINVFTADGPIEARLTGHRMRLKRPHPKVSVDPKDSEMLIVKPRGARLRFMIAPPQFFPLGIAFQLLGGVAEPTDLERLGFLNFKQMELRPDGNTLSITDAFKDNEADDRYKFSIIIQNSRDGTIGIIDPGIRHRPN
jgi:hypothetical protein